jgi:hypothetical protein
MANPNLIRNFLAEAAVNAFRIVKAGAADGQVLQAAAVGDKSIGVSTDIAAAINERCDVIMDGIADVTYGGAVTRGDLLTSDANGKAVTAAPGAGTNNRIIGIAVVSGVLDDVGQVNIAPSMMQG